MDRSPRKTAKQWAKLVSKYCADTLSEREFCAANDVKLASLRKWRYHVAAQNPKTPESAPAALVKVIAGATLPAQQSAALCIGQDVRRECSASYDVALLAQIALAAHRGR